MMNCKLHLPWWILKLFEKRGEPQGEHSYAAHLWHEQAKRGQDDDYGFS